jgi:hypothetical protein
MLVALLCIVVGIGIIWLGGIAIVISLGAFTNVLTKIAGAIIGAVIILLGLFVEFYFGWWGVIKAIIDYAKA